MIFTDTTLVDGLPKKIAKSTSMIQHPASIKARIRHICQVFVYQHMKLQGLIRESAMQVRTKPNAPTPRVLSTRVVDQLKSDISLCDSVQVVRGAWEDAALGAVINGELLQACRLLEDGLSPAVARRWERLEELDSEWAAPRSNVDFKMADMEVQQGTRRWDPNSLPPDHNENEEKLQILLNNHTKPVEVFQAKDRASQYRPEAKDVAGSATKDSNDDDDDQPFELCDQHCEPLKTRLFSVKKASGQQSSQGRSAPRKAKAKDAVERVPQNTGTCSECGAVSNNLAEHKKNCRGRCDRCHYGACIADPHGPACLSCKAKGFKHCKYSSKPKKEQTVLCHRCKRYIFQDTMRHHKQKCRGRCKPCQDANEPCAPTTGASATTKCQRCKATPGNLECTGFSHQHLFGTELKEKCKKCHLFYPNVKSHEVACKGRCQRCVDLKKGCGKKTSAGCSTCKTDKVVCPRNYSDAEKRGKCGRCKVDGLILRDHRSKCSGRCPGCVAAKQPCVNIPGDTSGRCARCRKEGIACGTKSHAHMIRMRLCQGCGNPYPSHSFSQHARICPGKCSNCHARGIACKRPPGAVGRGACDGCKEGKDGKPLVCDAKWMGPLKGKNKYVEDSN